MSVPTPEQVWNAVGLLSRFADAHEFADSEAEDSFTRGLASIRWAVQVESALAGSDDD